MIDSHSEIYAIHRQNLFLIAGTDSVLLQKEKSMHDHCSITRNMLHSHHSSGRKVDLFGEDNSYKS